MPHPTGDLAPQLANIRDYWLGYGVQDRADDGGLVLFRSGMPDDELNGVLRLPHGDALESALRAAARRLDGVPWRIWAGPDSDPDLPAALLRAGAAELETKPIMAIRPGQYRAPDPVPGLEIGELGAAADLAAWVGCYGPSFGIPPDYLAAQLQVEQARQDPPGALTRFAGRIGGVLAGTAALLGAHGVGGIYVVTVRAEFRRRGIGTALTAAALLSATERGLPVVTLHATPDGDPVYRRMGFSEVASYRVFGPPR